MKDAIAQYFTGIEAEKRKAICSLMDEWRTAVAPALTYFRDSGEYWSGDAYFCADGFFPNYYKQKHKVLFIGRETRDMAGDGYDYIEEFLGFFEDDRSHTNFMRHILQMVQLFKSDGNIAFEQLLSAKGYEKEMVKTGNYGFAVMEISKYSNNAKDGGKADWKLINKFLEDSHLEKRNYFQEELKILDPDYIITGNLLDGEKIEKKYLDLCFGKLTPLEGYPKDSPEAFLHEMDLDGKKVKLVDTQAFALPGYDADCFYTPIKELLFSDRGHKC
jgi:hypothetical protein